ncbi:hypothetical protein DAPPUDRAFT_280597, partial [Daphnia pulex]
LRGEHPSQHFDLRPGLSAQHRLIRTNPDFPRRRKQLGLLQALSDQSQTLPPLRRDVMRMIAAAFLLIPLSITSANAQTEPSVKIVSPDPLECPAISSDKKIYARCKLGTLELHLPSGYRLSELSLLASFDTELKALGDLAGAVLRIKTRKKTYSASSFVKIEDLSREPLPVMALEVQLDLPEISACDDAIDLSLALQASYSVNFAAEKIPPLKRYPMRLASALLATQAFALASSVALAEKEQGVVSFTASPACGAVETRAEAVPENDDPSQGIMGEACRANFSEFNASTSGAYVEKS